MGETAPVPHTLISDVLITPPLMDIILLQVCELDIIFNFEKAYYILDEFLMGGEIQETSKVVVGASIEEADTIQEVLGGALWWIWAFFVTHKMCF